MIYYVHAIVKNRYYKCNLCAFVREDEIFDIQHVGQNVTRNEAKYLGVILALLNAKKSALKFVEIHTDSRLIVDQLNKKHKLTRITLSKYAHHIWDNFKDIEKIFYWGSREQNKAYLLLDKAREE